MLQERLRRKSKEMLKNQIPLNFLYTLEHMTMSRERLRKMSQERLRIVLTQCRKKDFSFFHVVNLVGPDF